jgi:hypothetical protein
MNEEDGVIEHHTKKWLKYVFEQRGNYAHKHPITSNDQPSS